ncbi:hypothetical protein SNEBB_006572 [Seison nebaliae]|nr:hypothetical protein SNEBB_006572 [Seison nebaliae]
MSLQFDAISKGSDRPISPPPSYDNAIKSSEGSEEININQDVPPELLKGETVHIKLNDEKKFVNQEDVRKVLLNHYRKKKDFINIINSITIKSVEESYCLLLKIRSECEQRTTEKRWQLYRNEPYDGVQNGTVPSTWNAVPTNKLPTSFTIPHSYKVDDCEMCEGEGTNICDKCNGKGEVEFETLYGIVQPYRAEYTMKCFQCNKKGKLPCVRCRGRKKILSNTHLTVEKKVMEAEDMFCQLFTKYSQVIPINELRKFPSTNLYSSNGYQKDELVFDNNDQEVKEIENRIKFHNEYCLNNRCKVEKQNLILDFLRITRSIGSYDNDIIEFYIIGGNDEIRLIQFPLKESTACNIL